MEASQPISSKLSSTVPNSIPPMDPFVIIKFMGSDLDRAAFGLCSNLTVVAGCLCRNFYIYWPRPCDLLDDLHLLAKVLILSCLLQDFSLAGQWPCLCLFPLYMHDFRKLYLLATLLLWRLNTWVSSFVNVCFLLVYFCSGIF